MGIRRLTGLIVRKLVLVSLVVLVVVLILYFTIIRVPDPNGLYEQSPLDPGLATGIATPQAALTKREQLQATAREKAAVDSSFPAGNSKQILFGDAHVHTTWSYDAFMFSLPVLNASTGANPPAAACDYARYVSQLDFFFLTDHAESYTSRRWRDAQAAVRHCNAISGDAENPDLVAFLGFEWSQFGKTADSHYGHHNVLFKDIEEEKLPSRAIGAAGLASDALRGSSGGTGGLGMLRWLDVGNRSYYEALTTFTRELREEPDCPLGIDSTQLPTDCYESAANPGELYAKLDQWGFNTLVVPHGSAWGIYTPPGASWDHQLKLEYHDPEKGRLIEVYSGHGNSENYRDFQARSFDPDGKPYCPQPLPNYLPSCWQAGTIIRQRCLADGGSDSDCEQRAVEARQNYADVANVGGWFSVPGATAAEWLDAGQARDVFLPAFNYRPKKSVQYGLALRNFDDPENPLGFKWGLIGSSDTHFARPGNGFKQTPRIGTGDTGMRGARNAFWDWLIYRRNEEQPESRSRKVIKVAGDDSEQERKMSFLTAGGVVAVHATGRDRESIWGAMKRREVYGTSGHRMLLWFDVLNAGEHAQPMGSEVAMSGPPQFRTTAIGSFKQLPGCPEYVRQSLEEKRLQKLAKDECYNPSDERYLVDRIEVIRIRPQLVKDEPVQGLIDALWRVFECNPDPAGCTVEFTDPDFEASARDAVYYVRAIEEASPTINGDNLRPERDASGAVTKVNPCYGDFRIASDDDCQTLLGQRAWSSPIFINFDSSAVKVQ
ncbi:MAG: hypothetical protein ACI9GW_000377 [Halieaceae bacterium]|jgi:hypothetical protein